MRFNRNIQIHPALFIGIIFMATTLARAATAPANPNASAATKATLNYLYQISGKGILAGQESMMWDHGSGAHSSSRDKYVFDKTGKYPAYYSSDFGDVNAVSELAQRQRVVDNCIQRHNEGAIISLSWHAVQPDKPEEGGFNTMHIGNYASGNIDKMLTTGDPLNVEWLKRLDAIAGYLKQLQDNGVVVLWRPFHEMNGDWFWWCLQPRYKDLWKQEFDRFTTYHKLNNLLWVFSCNYYSEGDQTVKNLYSGHQYVDILGVDVYLEYGHQYAKFIHDDLLTLGDNRPIGITENGQMPDVSVIKTTMPKFCFWLTWFGFENKSDDNLYRRNYDDAYTITEDEVKIDTNVTVIERRSGFTPRGVEFRQSDRSLRLGFDSPANQAIEINRINGASVLKTRTSRSAIYLSLAAVSPGAYCISVRSDKIQFCQRLIVR